MTSSHVDITPAETTGMRLWLIPLVMAFVVGLWLMTAGAAHASAVFGKWSMRQFVVNGAMTYFALLAGFVMAGGRPIVRRMFAAVAVTVAAGCAWLLLELPALLGIVDYRLVLNSPFRKAWENPRNVLDPELLHLHRPHDEFSGVVKGDLVDWFGIPTDRRYTVQVRYDGRGFRNDQDRGAADLVMIGDSFVEGSLVNYEFIASTRLQELLGRPVLNLGQTGYGPQQQLAVLRRFGLPARPKVVVWMLFEGNDFTHDVLRYEQSVADWDDLVRRDHGFVKRSLARNALLKLAVATTPPRVDPESARKRSGRFDFAREAAEQTIYFAYEGRELPAPMAAAVDRAMDAVGEGVSLARREGASVLVAFAPTKYRVYHDLCSFDDDSEPAGWFVNDLVDRVRAWAEEKEIAFLDLTVPLREAATSGSLVYFADDGHWNAAGHEVAARAIADRLRGLGLIGG